MSTPVTDAAALSGQNAAGATGTVSYTVYSDANCRIPVTSGGVDLVTAGSVPVSDPVTLNFPGTYYWKVSYSGDGLNAPAVSNCGDEVETVSAAPGSHILDHFLCYTASSAPGAAGLGFKLPASVQLINQFSPGGFAPKIGAVDLDCNPAQKTVPNGVTQVANPNAHLLCWGIKAPPSSKTVVVSNQFGSAKVSTGATTQMCLPSWTTVKPRTGTPVAPPGLSHFACYSAGYVPGAATFKPPDSVLVKDQFTNKPVKVKVGAPKLLCLPTTKIADGVTSPALNPQAHLLCYAVSPTPTKNAVYDENQFGTGGVRIIKAGLLCLPST